MDILKEEASDGLYIEQSIETGFKEAAGWAKFIAVAGMIIAGIVGVMSLTIGTKLEAALNEGYVYSGTAGFLWILAVLLFAVSFFILCILLYRFANRMQAAIIATDQYEFIEAMKSLKNSFKAFAILFAVYFLLFIGSNIADLIK